MGIRCKALSLGENVRLAVVHTKGEDFLIAEVEIQDLTLSTGGTALAFDNEEMIRITDEQTLGGELRAPDGHRLVRTLPDRNRRVARRCPTRAHRRTAGIRD